MGAAYDVIRELIEERGLIRPRDLEARHVSRAWLTFFSGLFHIQKVAPALYGVPEHRYPPEAIVTVKQPASVLCLTSALWLNGELAQRPPELWAAIPRSVRIPKRLGIPAQFLRLDAARHGTDIETCRLAGVVVRFYSLDRTREDLRRYRWKLERAASRSPGARGAR